MAMRQAVDMVLNAFLSRQSAEKRAQLLKFLNDKDRERIEQLPVAAEDMSIEKFSNGAMLERVHWSWFLPTLKSYPPQEQSLFLASLDEISAIALAAEIPCKLPQAPLTPTGRAYLRQVLFDSLVNTHDRLLPIHFLPPSPLNRILNFSKKELIHLIDLLSMHYLALEIRQIVETKILKKIYSFLTDGQRQFLKLVTAKHEIANQPKLGLDRWDGSQESLQYLLHRKGLAILGTALYGQDPSLGWYVCHLLDIGRGSALFKSIDQKASRQAVDLAAKQVEELLGYDL